MADQSISEEQKQALVRIYLSFRREHEDERGDPVPPEPPAATAAERSEVEPAATP
jgi:hypothetical protein